MLKFLPPLTIEEDLLTQGLDIVAESYKAVLEDEVIMKELGLITSE